MAVQGNARPEVRQGCKQDPLVLVLACCTMGFRTIAVLGQAGLLSISGLTLQLQAACNREALDLTGTEHQTPVAAQPPEQPHIQGKPGQLLQGKRQQQTWAASTAVLAAMALQTRQVTLSGKASSATMQAQRLPRVHQRFTSWRSLPACAAPPGTEGVQGYRCDLKVHMFSATQAWEHNAWKYSPPNRTCLPVLHVQPLRQPPAPSGTNLRSR